MSTYRRKKRKTKPAKVNPEHQMLFDELCETLYKLGIEVRMENGYFEGGQCIVQDKKYFFLNKNHLIEQNIELLISELKSMDLGNIYLSPRLRTSIEDKSTIVEE